MIINKINKILVCFISGFLFHIGILWNTTVEATDSRSGHLLDLRLGEEAVVKPADLTVRFQAVGKDSRCPQDAPACGLETHLCTCASVTQDHPRLQLP